MPNKVPLARRIDLPGFAFDLERCELRTTQGVRVSLRPRSLAVLACLARRLDETVSKDELIRTAWPDVVVTEDSLVQCIRDLRRTLNDPAHRVIETESKRGYRLVPSGSASSEMAAAARAGLDEFSQEVHFASSGNGIRIAYATSGTGPPLVRTAQWMTHLEWDWHSSIFGEFIQRLARRNRFLRYDGRGCGLSDRGVPMASLDDEVRDLEAVVDAAGLERFALLGRSQGGAIAIRYAARHPQRVTKLVTVGGLARGASHRGENSRSLESIMAFCKVLEDGWGNANSAFRQVWTSQAFPGATAEQQDAYNQLQRVACSPRDAATLHRMNCDYNALADLPLVRCPALVIHNPDDALIPFEEGRLIASHIPGARLEYFKSPNHVPLPGEPAFEQVMRLIEEFLSEPTNAEEHVPRGQTEMPSLRLVSRSGQS